MLQSTFDRLCLGFSPEDIFVATSVNHAAIVQEQLPKLIKDNLILEPCRRDTASAIGFALLQISRTRPDEIFVLINSDAHVKNVQDYCRVIISAGRFIEKNKNQTVLIGITPTYPETGFGYIKSNLNKKREEDGLVIYDVDQFVEKPDLETAKQYLIDGSYLWNPTLIVASINNFLSLYKKHLPEHAALYDEIRDAFNKDNERELVESLFTKLPSISVDYGILEKEKNLLVMPANFGWMDIGNWRTVRDILATNESENIVCGRHLEIDSFGNFIHCSPEKMVATIGVSNLIIVDTGDTLLVCPQDRAHEVRHIVEKLKKEDWQEFL
jgi:mannose-1-phosphate guanylyltransferase